MQPMQKPMQQSMLAEIEQVITQNCSIIIDKPIYRLNNKFVEVIYKNGKFTINTDLKEMIPCNNKLEPARESTRCQFIVDEYIDIIKETNFYSKTFKNEIEQKFHGLPTDSHGNPINVQFVKFKIGDKVIGSLLDVAKSKEIRFAKKANHYILSKFKTKIKFIEELIASILNVKSVTLPVTCLLPNNAHAIKTFIKGIILEKALKNDGNREVLCNFDVDHLNKYINELRLRLMEDYSDRTFHNKFMEVPIELLYVFSNYIKETHNFKLAAILKDVYQDLGEYFNIKILEEFLSLIWIEDGIMIPLIARLIEDKIKIQLHQHNSMLPASYKNAINEINTTKSFDIEQIYALMTEKVDIFEIANCSGSLYTSPITKLDVTQEHQLIEADLRICNNCNLLLSFNDRIKFDVDVVDPRFGDFAVSVIQTELAKQIEKDLVPVKRLCALNLFKTVKQPEKIPTKEINKRSFMEKCFTTYDIIRIGTFCSYLLPEVSYELFKALIHRFTIDASNDVEYIEKLCEKYGIGCSYGNNKKDDFKKVEYKKTNYNERINGRSSSYRGGKSFRGNRQKKF